MYAMAHSTERILRKLGLLAAVALGATILIYFCEGCSTRHADASYPEVERWWAT